MEMWILTNFFQCNFLFSGYRLTLIANKQLRGPTSHIFPY